MTLDQFQDATFRPLLEQKFVFRVPPEFQLETTLTQVSTKPHEGHDRQQFSLLFTGPAAPVWRQGTYQVENATLGTFEIFISPVARTAAGTEYEAIFT